MEVGTETAEMAPAEMAPAAPPGLSFEIVRGR